MRIRIPSRGSLADFSTSMTDISFLLIIFFLIAAVFVADEGLALLLPDEGEEPEPFDPRKAILVELEAGGGATVDGKAAGPGELGPVLAAAIGDKAGAAVVLRTAPALKYAELVAAIDLARSAGASRFSVVCRREEPVPVLLEEGRRP